MAHELRHGACRSQKVSFNPETLRLPFADLVILDFGREDARVVGAIRAGLARQGHPLGRHDVLIAGSSEGAKPAAGDGEDPRVRGRGRAGA